MENLQSTTSDDRIYTYVQFFTQGVLTSRDVHSQAELAETEDGGAVVPVRINFKFSGTCLFSGWIIINQQNFTFPQLISGANWPFDETSVFLNLPDLLNYDQARQTLLEMIENWPVREEDRQTFVNSALDKAQRVVRSLPANHNVVDIHLRMNVGRVHFFDPRRPESSVPPPAAVRQHPTSDDVIQRSIDAHEVRMIPAEDSSIESLERRKILVKDSVETNCSICLEEISRGSEAVRMACSHPFHENCIKKWLRTGHNCPLCRFALPARSC